MFNTKLKRLQGWGWGGCRYVEDTEFGRNWERLSPSLQPSLSAYEQLNRAGPAAGAHCPWATLGKSQKPPGTTRAGEGHGGYHPGDSPGDGGAGAGRRATPHANP